MNQNQIITYDLILKYLKNDNIVTDKNTFNYNLIFNFFPNTFFRYGITKFTNNNDIPIQYNISFWSSFLTLYDNNFMIPYELDENTIINNFKNYLLDNYSKRKLSNTINKLSKNDFRERFKLEPDIDVLQYIVNILDINIIVFVYTDDNIQNINVLYNKFLNFDKNTFLFFKFKNMWEPIMENKNNELIKIFNKYNNIIDIILKNKHNISYYKNIKEVIYNDINITNNSKELIIEQSDTNNSKELIIEQNTIIPPIKYNKTTLNKLKISEINEIIKLLNIDIKDIKPIKNNLIELIINRK